MEIVEAAATTTISCSHDGYMRLPGQPVHHRQWLFKDRSLLVTDTITGSFQKAEARYHFHPAIYVEKEDSTARGFLRVEGGSIIHWKVTGGNCWLVDAAYHPEFGVSIANKCLIIGFESPEVEIEFSW